MTMFGLKEAVVAPLLRAVVGEEVSTAALPERFARAAWTGIAEPGDRIAGALVAALGAADALTTLVEHWDVERVLAGIIAAGVDAVEQEELGAAFDRWAPRLRSSIALTSLKQAARYSVQLIVPGDECWPLGLADLGEHAPLALWTRGNASTLATLPSSIALVGARAATGYGEHVAMEASAGLVDRGYTIVSGAAYGIDGMAHRAALASSGTTIAFLAGGVDRFYPSGHEALLTRIVEEGAVVSELPCGQPPTKWRFLQRNRLIAAASQATVVLEAGWRSGSLNTAGHAAAIGRPLGAVPGPVTSAASAGCHRLIRDFDARCVTNADEMAELAPMQDAPVPAETPRNASGGDRLRVRMLDALAPRSTRPVDEIARRAGLSVSEVQSALGALQLEGAVTEREGGWVKVVSRT
ncbi:DNA-processing protein DprA [Parafrigoribacterium soli]|uniref:DNA-processing protein DprA n=1 Tax=Parafrigoribacterium soli TaxID=3144663 RepID=UPI0032EADB1E